MSQFATIADTIVAESETMRNLLGAVARTATGADGVLVSGESGTGRGLVSQLLHEHGRRSGPYVEISCDTLGPSATEIALFGRADARGGNGSRAGSRSERFECVWPGSGLHRAIGGTVCLRCVEELPERAQTKLARVFRDGEFVVGPPGPAQEHGIRLVVIAGDDCEHLVREGRIRPDLHRRFTSATLAVPALRDRRADIPLLATLFAGEASSAASLPPPQFTWAAKSLLKALPWWGNARELQTLVKGMVLLCEGTTIDLDALLSQLRLDQAATRTPVVPANETLRAARARFEREYITAVLAHHHGRIPDAAKSLGIQRTNLYRKLRHLELRRDTASPARF